MGNVNSQQKKQRQSMNSQQMKSSKKYQNPQKQISQLYKIPKNNMQARQKQSSIVSGISPTKSVHFNPSNQVLQTPQAHNNYDIKSFSSHFQQQMQIQVIKHTQQQSIYNSSQQKLDIKQNFTIQEENQNEGDSVTQSYKYFIKEENMPSRTCVFGKQKQKLEQTQMMEKQKYQGEFRQIVQNLLLKPMSSNKHQRQKENSLVDQSYTNNTVDNQIENEYNYDKCSLDNDQDNSMESQQSYMEDIEYIKGVKINGRVYEGMEQSEGRTLAVKTYTQKELKNLEIIEDLDVIFIIQRKMPSNFCKYLSIIEGKDECYDILMEKVPNSMQDVIKQYGNINEQLLKAYVRQILDGLQALHSEKIVHGNLKQSNILMENNGQIKISDINIFQINFYSLSLLRSINSAPEVLCNSTLIPASDIWSLGILIIEMICGQSPWIDDKGQLLTITQVEKLLKKEIMFELPMQISTHLSKFLRCMLKINPRDRWSANKLLNHYYLQDCDMNDASQQMSILVGQSSNNSNTANQNNMNMNVLFPQFQSQQIPSISTITPASNFKKVKKRPSMNANYTDDDQQIREKQQTLQIPQGGITPNYSGGNRKRNSTIQDMNLFQKNNPIQQSTQIGRLDYNVQNKDIQMDDVSMNLNIINIMQQNSNNFTQKLQKNQSINQQQPVNPQFNKEKWKENVYNEVGLDKSGKSNISLTSSMNNNQLNKSNIIKKKNILFNQKSALLKQSDLLKSETNSQNSFSQIKNGSRRKSTSQHPGNFLGRLQSKTQFNNNPIVSVQKGGNQIVIKKEPLPLEVQRQQREEYLKNMIGLSSSDEDNEKSKQKQKESSLQKSKSKLPKQLKLSTNSNPDIIKNTSLTESEKRKAIEKQMNQQFNLDSSTSEEEDQMYQQQVSQNTIYNTLHVKERKSITTMEFNIPAKMNQQIILSQMQKQTPIQIQGSQSSSLNNQNNQINNIQNEGNSIYNQSSYGQQTSCKSKMQTEIDEYEQQLNHNHIVPTQTFNQNQIGAQLQKIPLTENYCKTTSDNEDSADMDQAQNNQKEQNLNNKEKQNNNKYLENLEINKINNNKNKNKNGTDEKLSPSSPQSSGNKSQNSSYLECNQDVLDEIEEEGDLEDQNSPEKKRKSIKISTMDQSLKQFSKYGSSKNIQNQHMEDRIQRETIKEESYYSVKSTTRKQLNSNLQGSQQFFKNCYEFSGNNTLRQQQINQDFENSNNLPQSPAIYRSNNNSPQSSRQLINNPFSKHQHQNSHFSQQNSNSQNLQQDTILQQNSLVQSLSSAGIQTTSRIGNPRITQYQNQGEQMQKPVQGEDPDNMNDFLDIDSSSCI